MHPHQVGKRIPGQGKAEGKGDDGKARDQRDPPGLTDEALASAQLKPRTKTSITPSKV